MPYDYGTAIIRSGVKAKREDDMWQLYCQVFPNMTKETFIPFNRFVDELTKEPDKHSATEILDKTAQILNMHFTKE